MNRTGFLKLRCLGNDGVFLPPMIISILLMIVLGASSPDASLSREEREIMMAEKAVLNSLMVSQSRQARSICWVIRDLCLNSGVGELGIALIARHGDTISVRKLAELLRFQFDAAYSTALTCYLLEKKQLALNELRKIDFEYLTKKCGSEVADFQFRHSKVFRDVGVGLICRSESQITDKLSEIMDTLIAGKECDPEDF